MVHIEHIDFMRAILFHRLNIFYSVDSVNKSHWTLGHEIVCTEERDGKNVFTMVSESFKSHYVDTMPKDAVMCKTCVNKAKCDIIRENLCGHCNLWKNDVLTGK